MYHIIEVARRLRGLRESLDLDLGKMSELCGIDPESLAAYESGTVDIHVSALHQIAEAAGVEPAALLFGSEPRMETFCVTRAGRGAKVERTAAYSYQDLAAGMRHRVLAPYMVTIQPGDTEKPQEPNVHSGQEFNYVVSGDVEISVGGKTTLLHPGDSIMFDSRLPHALKAVGPGAACVLAIIS